MSTAPQALPIYPGLIGTAAVVIGASTGIGAESARYLAANMITAYCAYFSGCSSNFFLQPDAQKYNVLPWYSLWPAAFFSSICILHTGSVTIVSSSQVRPAKP